MPQNEQEQLLLPEMLFLLFLIQTSFIGCMYHLSNIHFYCLMKSKIFKCYMYIFLLLPECFCNACKPVMQNNAIACSILMLRDNLIKTLLFFPPVQNFQSYFLMLLPFEIDYKKGMHSHINQLFIVVLFCMNYGLIHCSYRNNFSYKMFNQKANTLMATLVFIKST